MKSMQVLRNNVAGFRLAVPTYGKAFILSALMVAGCSGTCQRQSEKAEKGDSTFLYQTGPKQKEVQAPADSTKVKKEDVIKATPKKLTEAEAIEKIMERLRKNGTDTTSQVYKYYETKLEMAKKGVKLYPPIE